MASDMCVFTVWHQADGVVQVPVHVMVAGEGETVHCGYLPVVPGHDAQDTYALLWEALAGIGAVWARSPVRVAYVTRGRARGPLVVPITREARGPQRKAVVEAIVENGAAEATGLVVVVGQNASSRALRDQVSLLTSRLRVGGAFGQRPVLRGAQSSADMPEFYDGLREPGLRLDLREIFPEARPECSGEAALEQMGVGYVCEVPPSASGAIPSGRQGGDDAGASQGGRQVRCQARERRGTEATDRGSQAITTRVVAVGRADAISVGDSDDAVSTGGSAQTQTRVRVAGSMAREGGPGGGGGHHNGGPPGTGRQTHGGVDRGAGRPGGPGAGVRRGFGQCAACRLP